MRALIFISIFALAACGADGAPEPVEPKITISGQAKIGVAGTL